MATAATNSLVSYSAPAADSTTFFVDNLTGTAVASTAGLFAGAGTQQDEVSYGYITTVKNVTATTACSWFGFHTLTENAGTNSTGNDIVGVDTGVVPAFTSINSDVATQGSGTGIETEYFRIQRDFLDTLSDHVFGHRDSADLFSNQEAVKDAWDTAEAAAVTNANNSMDTAANGASAATTSITASKELVEALLVSNSARFSLGYTATVNGPFTAETTSGLNVVVSQGGTPTIVAKANVVMSGANFDTIKSIAIASDTTPGTITFTLTALQATQLNGTAGGTTIAIDNTTTTNFVVATTTGLSVLPSDSNGGSGAGAIVTVIASGATALTSITITGTGSGYAENDEVIIGDLSTALDQDIGDLTGAGYTLGDTITITDSASSSIITISSINHVQVAILNGTLAGSSNTTNPPLETGDKIRLKFGVDSALTQKNASNTAIDFRQSYYIDYQLQ